MKRIVLALVCALMPAAALAQDPYAQGQSAYDQSQRSLFFSSVELSAAQFGSGAGCGVISPGLGMQLLSNLLDYTEARVGFSQQEGQMVAAYKAAYNHKACSYWMQNPLAVAQLRQMGQEALTAVWPNMQTLP